MDENKNEEFVSHFFQPVSNKNSKSYDHRLISYDQHKNNNNGIETKDVFCFTGLMQSLLEPSEFENGIAGERNLECASFGKDNVFNREELVSNDVGVLFGYANRISADCESNECSDIATARIPSGDEPRIQMKENNELINAEFVSKYFVQTAELSAVTLDEFDCSQKLAEEDYESEELLIDKDTVFNTPHGIQNSEEFCDSYEYNEEEREFRMSQLDPQSETIIIEPFFNISSRNMPVSPHGIIEDEFKSNPWAMLVATIFLTKTTGKAARPLMKEFFLAYPTPYDVLATNPAELEKYFIKLGMRKRANMIWRMSYEFVSAKWRRASDLHGIGKYGEDAFRIFCLGHTDIEPNDRYLKLYLDWLESQTDHVETYGKVDSEFVIVDPVLKYYSITLR